MPKNRFLYYENIYLSARFFDSQWFYFCAVTAWKVSRLTRKEGKAQSSLSRNRAVRQNWTERREARLFLLPKKSRSLTWATAAVWPVRYNLIGWATYMHTCDINSTCSVSADHLINRLLLSEIYPVRTEIRHTSTSDSHQIRLHVGHQSKRPGWWVYFSIVLISNSELCIIAVGRVAQRFF